MSDLKNKLNAIINDLDKNIKNKEDLEYVKSQMYSVSTLLLDEIDKIVELNLGKLNYIMDKSKELNKRIDVIERKIQNIENEMYIADGYNFEIQCPYCHNEFVEDFTDGYKNEVRCPECDNIVQLEWSQNEECCENSTECRGECSGHCISEKKDMNDNQEDDDM